VPVEGQLASVAHASGSRIASAAETLSETMFSESAFGYRRSGIVLLTGFVTLAAIFAIFGAPSLA
jgi:hypothetical protein